MTRRHPHQLGNSKSNAKKMPPNQETTEPKSKSTSSPVRSKRPGLNTEATVYKKLPAAVDIQDFGAVGDGKADDTAAFQAAIDSGAPMIKVSGSTTVTSTINLLSNQIVYIGAGNSIVWNGPAGSTMFESPADKMYVRAGIWCDGGYIDMSGCSTGIRLHSYQYCLFDWESTDSTNNTTSTIVDNISDSTTDTDSVTGTRNTTNNYWRRLIHHYTCGTLLRLAGLGDSAGHLVSGNTLNSFGKLRSDGNCAQYGIDIGPWCDTNDFQSMVSLNCGTAATAINLRDYNTVYCLTFHHVNVAMYGSPSGRRGIYIGNQVRWATVENMFVDASNTAESDAGAIVDGGAISYRVNLYRETGTYAGMVESRSKNASMLSNNFAFGEQFYLSAGKATNISYIPTNGCIVAYNSSNGDFTGLCYVRATASPACFTIAGNTTYIVFATGALNDGGGTNGRLTISAGTDGKLYLSNRTSQGLHLTVSCLSGLF